MRGPILERDTLAVQFIGSTRALALLGARNVALSFVTMGLYIPWALTNVRRYIWQHLLLHGEPLAYRGNAEKQVSLLPWASWAQIAIVLVYLALRGFGLSLPSFAGAAISANGFFGRPFDGLLPYFGTGGLASLFWSASRGVGLFAGLRYRLQHTEWRSHVFDLKGNTLVYSLRYAGRLALAWLTFGYFYPNFAVYSRQELCSRLTWAGHEGDYLGTVQEARWLYARGVVLCVLTLGIYLPWHIAHLRNYHYSQVSLGPVSVACTQDGLGLSLLWSGNMAIAFFSLGLGYGWMTARSLRYAIDHLELTGAELLHLAEVSTSSSKMPEGSGLADLATATVLLW